MPARKDVTEWVLVRGLTREQRHWHAFPEALAESSGARVTTIDAPGFGTENARRSPATIEEITDDIRSRLQTPAPEGERAILGISLGGMVALDWCSRYPDEFAFCTVVNTLAREVFRPHYLTLRALSVLGLRSFRSPRAHEQAVADLTVTDPAIDRNALALRWVSFHHDAPPTTASIRAQASAGLTFRLPGAVPTPLAVLAARGDRLADPRMSLRIAERYGARVYLHPSAGHDLPVDDPDWICRILRAVTGA
ncbi:alpha/beta hydrolase [Gordonia caeni]|uniref:Alpha/beta hydrolase n=1 Tax=Gordonia caeni TaxID=1007097 RepID=A0ABP7NKI6_9ACTN